MTDYSSITHTGDNSTGTSSSTRLRLLTLKGWITSMVVPNDLHIPLSRQTEIEILSQLSPGETSFINLHGNATLAGSDSSEDLRVDVSPEGKLLVTRIAPVRKSFSHGALVSGGMTASYSEAMRNVADTDAVIRSLQQQLADAQRGNRNPRDVQPDGDQNLPVNAQGAGNIFPDTSLPSKTGRYWIDEVVTVIEGNLFYLYTPSAELNNKNDENHLQLTGGTTWYSHTLGDILLEPSDIPNCVSVRNGSIVNYNGVYYWFASVKLKNDDSGKQVALLQSSSLRQKPRFVDFVLLSNGRDPRVTVTSGEKPFLMAISRLDGVEFYRSGDGNSWTLENTFSIPNMGTIECPQYIPNLNGQEALLFCGNGYEQGDTTGSYLSWGSYSDPAGWQESARQRVDAGADCYGGYLDIASWKFYSWVGNWNYATDLLLGKSFGQITTQQICYLRKNQISFTPINADDAYPAHMSKKNINFSGDNSDFGFRQVPQYSQIEFYFQGALQEGEFIALTGGGVNMFSLTKIGGGYEFSRNHTTTIPLYDESSFNRTEIIALQDGGYTKIIMRLTPWSLNLYLETGSDIKSAQYFITQPHDALSVKTHFLQSFDTSTGAISHQNIYSGYAALHYVPQDVRAPIGITKEDIDGFVLGYSDTPTDDEVTNIYYRPQDSSGNLDYITCKYRDKNGVVGYVSLRDYKWVEDNFETKTEADNREKNILNNTLTSSGGTIRGGNLTFAPPDGQGASGWYSPGGVTWHLPGQNGDVEIYGQLDGNKHPQFVIAVPKPDGTEEYWVFGQDGSLQSPIGSIPSVITPSGNVAIQAFTYSTSGKGRKTVYFPRNFKSGTTPIVVATVDWESDGSDRFVEIANPKAVSGRAPIDNTSFICEVIYSDNKHTGVSTGAAIIQIIAIGVV